MSITGLPGQGPVRVGIPIADLCAGLFCALGILIGAARARESPAKGSGSPPRCCRRRSSCSTSRPRAGCRRTRWPSRPATIIRPRIPTGVFKTKDGHINIASAGHVMWERLCHAIGAPEFIDAARTSRPARCARRTATRVNAAIEAMTVRQDQRGMDRYLQRGRRAVRADLFDRPGVRRRAGQASGHRAKRHAGRTARSRPSSASRSRCRARRARSRRRRPSSASTPTRCSRNSASPTRKSPRCTPPTRCDAMTETTETVTNDPDRQNAVPQGGRRRLS